MNVTKLIATRLIVTRENIHQTEEYQQSDPNNEMMNEPTRHTRTAGMK
jgi:hypothetical protein